MPQIPRDSSPDSSLAFWREGYDFISRRCRRYDADLFEVRLLLQKTICMRGEAAARLFYDNQRFVRQGAMPAAVIKTLLGEGGVQGLDDKAHRHRKQLFMSLMTPEAIGQLAKLTARQLRTAAERWAKTDRVVLFEALHEVLTRAVCAWAAVPLAEAEVESRTRDFGAMIDAAGAVGPRLWWGRQARKRAEAWVGELVEQVRKGTLEVPENSPLGVVARHRDLEGNRLERQIAAVELLNLLRPVVAIARFVTFAALALHRYPHCRRALEEGDGDYRAWFVQEVRRYYPFFPCVAARVRHDFTWNGYPFPRGTRVLLDLYGTDRDERLWEQPDSFHPERFRQWDGSAYDFIPQGGGDHYHNHRCAGEWVTIELMKVAVQALTETMTYRVPPQDLAIDPGRIPAIPASRFVISDVSLTRA
ncbi:MAG: cytochrome P450 [Candidatus Competibacteraceae bacterium]|nr:cytochrome P450 [Candidatus Competibacteraceae bacterium]